ncbi:hypothetical protein LJC61_02260 [Ruminococcaceae bacterium OttesenSCG-928-A16]|nr:hypothetical protein [Ruminococcaceae bacterium OttesenSCG-928-A16]
MKKTIAFTLTFILLCGLVLVGCSGKKIDMEKCVNVTTTGQNGHAKAKASVDLAMLEAQYMGENGDFESAMKIANFETSLSVTVTPNENLSNGDKVTVKIGYSKEAAKKAKVSVKNETFTFTVEGLSDGEPYDAFANISLVYKGVSPQLQVEIQNKASDNFGKSLRYTAEPTETIAKGDNITITVDASRVPADSMFYVTEERKTFIADNVPSYLMANEIDDGKKGILEGLAYDAFKDDWTSFFGGVIEPEVRKSVPEILAYDVEIAPPAPERMMLATAKSVDEYTYNIVFVIFRLTITGGDAGGITDVWIPFGLSNVALTEANVLKQELDGYRENVCAGAYLDIESAQAAVENYSANAYTLQAIG